MILPFLALLAFQDAPPMPCTTGDTPAQMECNAKLAIEAGDHALAAAQFVTLAQSVDDPASKARALAAAAPLFAVAGKLDDAQATAANALALNALTPLQQGWTHLDRAQALYRLDRKDEADTAWLAAGETVAEDPYYWLTGAAMALQSQQLDAARTRVDAGLERAKDSPELLLLSGQIALAAEDLPAARKAFTDAVIAMPDHPAGRAAAKALDALTPQ